MLTLLKLLQYLVRTLHSDGTSGQVAAGVTLGAALGLTPLMSVHNLVVVGAILLLDVSVGGAFLGFLVFTPAGFMLDPGFDRLGAVLLESPAIRGLWTALYNTPGPPLSNFNNTIVLGSVLAWAVLAFPMYFASRTLVTRYRATVGARVRNSKWYKAITASRLVGVYRLMRPE